MHYVRVENEIKKNTRSPNVKVTVYAFFLFFIY